MRITEKIATIYHTARGIIKMKFSVKHAKFKQNDYLVQTHMRMVITEVETLEQVPNFGNLREMVRLAVEEFKRKEAELKAIEEVATPKEVVTEVPKEVVVAPAPVSEQPKVEEAPKEVVTATATVSEAPKDNTESERKEEHAE
nr:MAG TPA: hypothetical protein [Caudoviricetes sp.]